MMLLPKFYEVVAYIDCVQSVRSINNGGSGEMCNQRTTKGAERGEEEKNTFFCRRIYSDIKKNVYMLWHYYDMLPGNYLFLQNRENQIWVFLPQESVHNVMYVQLWTVAVLGIGPHLQFPSHSLKYHESQPLMRKACETPQAIGNHFRKIVNILAAPCSHLERRQTPHAFLIMEFPFCRPWSRYVNVSESSSILSYRVLIGYFLRRWVEKLP